MNIKEFAEKINGFHYPSSELDKLNDEAKDNGFLIVYGMSDDLLEMRGIIRDEVDAYDGVKTKIGKKGIDCEAVWSPSDKPRTSWEIKVDCVHEKFHIVDDDDIYCIGAVIHKDELNL